MAFEWHYITINDRDIQERVKQRSERNKFREESRQEGKKGGVRSNNVSSCLSCNTSNLDLPRFCINEDTDEICLEILGRMLNSVFRLRGGNFDVVLEALITGSCRRYEADERYRVSMQKRKLLT